MNYCEKCGAKLESGATFCVSCGNKIISTPVKQVTSDDDKKANRLGIISLILHFGATPVIGYISKVAMFASADLSEFIAAVGVLACYITSLVLMIIGRVKYPKNTLCKVVMWIYISLFAVVVIGLLLLVGIIYSIISFLS